MELYNRYQKRIELSLKLSSLEKISSKLLYREYYIADFTLLRMLIFKIWTIILRKTWDQHVPSLCQSRLPALPINPVETRFLNR